MTFDPDAYPGTLIVIPEVIVDENAYVSLEDAEAIVATTLFCQPWLTATASLMSAQGIQRYDDQTFVDVRAQALCTATALLDRLRWTGRPLLPTQRLAWPRVPQGCPQGYPLSVAIPDEIRIACVELAIFLLSNGAMPTGIAVQQRMLGDAMTMNFAHVGDELPKHVRRLIEPYLRVSSANVAEVAL